MASAGSHLGLADRLHLSMTDQESTNMALNKEGLIQELKQQIHSLLAAVQCAVSYGHPA